MQFTDAVSQRYSCRAFLPDLVPQIQLEEIFTLAGKAPSNCNVQPWHTHVVSGAACDSMREKMAAAITENPQGSPDFTWSGKFAGTYQERQICAALGLWEKQGVDRKDREKRDWSWMRNFKFFDAPHAAFIFLPTGFAEELRIAGDVGMYAQTLMLALTDAGLASCPQTSLSFFPDVVREACGVDDSYRLLMGLSFGYPDLTDAANEFRTERAPLSDTTVFHS